MGAAVSLFTGKARVERDLRDSKVSLQRAMSKANSMEALDKALITELKSDIKKSESMLSMFEHLMKEEAAEERL
jgi:hypothetical protein